VPYVVGGEIEAAAEEPGCAAYQVADRADVGAEAVQRDQLVSNGVLQYLPLAPARLDPRGSPVRVNSGAIHPPGVDQHRVVAGTADPCPVASTATARFCCPISRTAATTSWSPVAPMTYAGRDSAARFSPQPFLVISLLTWSNKRADDPVHTSERNNGGRAGIEEIGQVPNHRLRSARSRLRSAVWSHHNRAGRPSA
jgi:hypothetical protein